MDMAELVELQRLLSVALTDDEISGMPVPGARGKRAGTDLARALDVAGDAIERRRGAAAS